VPKPLSLPTAAWINPPAEPQEMIFEDATERSATFIGAV
jgi:hypothetical protein